MAPPRYECGFRHSPREYLENSDSLQSALVRTNVFNRPKPSDPKQIEDYFQSVFAKQRPDGGLADEHDQGLLAATGETVPRLLLARKNQRLQVRESWEKHCH